ncbi:MAG: cobyric acid synthase CobQ, partial [Cyanobacteria bacterium P01_E01_bin.45]
EVEIAVLRLPRIANFTDFDPLNAEPSIKLRYVTLDEPLGSPDVVILPGSKATISDLRALQKSGMAEQVRQFSGAIAGVCGGMQMLGQAIADPEGIEGEAATVRGLELLPLETTFTGDKVTQQVSTSSRWMGEMAIAGYEIHQGHTQFGADATPMFDRPELGCVSENGRVWGTYLHGLFDNHVWRRQWLNRVRAEKGLRPLPILDGHYSVERDRLLDRLADAWHPHLHLDRIGYYPKSM